jgi:hypothetical protein
MTQPYQPNASQPDGRKSKIRMEEPPRRTHTLETAEDEWLNRASGEPASHLLDSAPSAILQRRPASPALAQTDHARPAFQGWDFAGVPARPPAADRDAGPAGPPVIQRHSKDTETTPPTHKWNTKWVTNRKQRELPQVLAVENQNALFKDQVNHIWEHAQSNDPGYGSIAQQLVEQAVAANKISKGDVLEVYKASSDATPGSFSFSQKVPESDKIVIHAHMKDKDTISPTDTGDTGAVHWKWSDPAWAKKIKGYGKIPPAHRAKVLNIAGAAAKYAASGTIAFQETSGWEGKRAEAVGEELGSKGLPPSVLALIGQYVR